MREIKFRAFEHGEMTYSHNNEINHGNDQLQWFFRVITRKANIMQYTGLKDKNGKEVYEGDEIQFRKPYRTTQTHCGDNIPNGSYTEPMEPGIKTISGVVVFKDGTFILEGEDNAADFSTPLCWYQTEWDLESIKDAISYGRPDRFLFDDPEEGDLQYLVEECAKVENSKQLIEYLNGFEIIGNIYENPELLKQSA